MRRGLVVSLVCAAAMLAAAPARALDKQGSAHGGEIEGADQAGSRSAAARRWACRSSTRATRPARTIPGLALFRYAAHLDFDLIGRRLSIPLDLNMFTDRTAVGTWRKVVPSELDVITGVTSTWRLGPGALEGGARIEVDGTLDKGGYPGPTSQRQTYGDVRARYLYSLAAIAPRVGEALRGGDVSGWLTLGWFAINQSYFARPNNTGLALFRYAAHAEISFWNDHLALGLDAIIFTDKLASNVFRPTELDFTPELIVRHARYEVHLAYERDMPLDQDSLIQQFVYLLASVSF